MLDNRGSTLTTPTKSLTAHEDPEAEGPSRALSGRVAILTTTLAPGLSLYALYWVIGIIQPQIYRVSFLLLTLVDHKKHNKTEVEINILDPEDAKRLI